MKYASRTSISYYAKATLEKIGDDHPKEYQVFKGSVSFYMLIASSFFVIHNAEDM